MSTKYKFIEEEDGYDGSKTITTKVAEYAEHASMSDVLYSVADFLRGCGYVIDGELRVIKDE